MGILGGWISSDSIMATHTDQISFVNFNRLPSYFESSTIRGANDAIDQASSGSFSSNNPRCLDSRKFAFNWFFHNKAAGFSNVKRDRSV